MRAAARIGAAAVALLALAGCASRGPAGIDLDTSVTAQGQSSRARYVVLHYTTSDDARSLHILSTQKVSAHYLVADAPAGKVYRLVDENRAAWHAGASAWYAQRSLNFTSIGVEVVNPGFTEGPGGERIWHPYQPRQIQTLVALLQDVIRRHGIAPENVVGHSDIAPQRKLDPGPLFPWRELAQAGIGRWYDEAGAAQHVARMQTTGLPDVAWFQQQLARLGYDTPQHGQLDRATINVLAAFQMHYRPATHDGQPDVETAAIMLAMP